MDSINVLRIIVTVASFALFIGLNEVQPRQSILDHTHMLVANAFVPPQLAHGDAKRVRADGGYVVRNHRATRAQTREVDRRV